MHFASDNWAGAAPQVMDALAREARQTDRAYGDAKADRRAARLFNELFEREVAVFFVATGTAANALALASANRPGGVVLCHRESHIIEDECGAVEYLTGGGRLLGLDGISGKLDAQTIRTASGRFPPDFVHGGRPMAVSITQASEAGTVYEPAEVKAIAEAAAGRSLPLHMDGARFANAVAALEIAPADITWRAGVDLLSFGGTKNGCIAAEAVVVFDPAHVADMPYLRKRAGQLFSKSRFIAAQFEALLTDGLWLRLAGQANHAADRLRAGIETASRSRLAWPTRGNEVFVILPEGVTTRLRAAGAAFYDWQPPQGAAQMLGPGETLARLVTSYATQDAEIDQLLSLLSRVPEA